MESCFYFCIIIDHRAKSYWESMKHRGRASYDIFLLFLLFLNVGQILYIYISSTGPLCPWYPICYLFGDLSCGWELCFLCFRPGQTFRFHPFIWSLQPSCHLTHLIILSWISDSTSYLFASHPSSSFKLLFWLPSASSFPILLEFFCLGYFDSRFRCVVSILINILQIFTLLLTVMSVPPYDIFQVSCYPVMCFISLYANFYQVSIAECYCA